jgi:tetratricopeptide (TPR) repeat protein
MKVLVRSVLMLRWVAPLFLVVCVGCASSGDLATQGFSKLAKGRVPAAEEKFTKSLFKNPGDARATYGLCMVRREQESIQAAVNLCKAALELSPNDGEIHLTLGELYAQQLDYAGAVTESRMAYEWLRGDNSRAAYKLARFLAVQGEGSTAMAWLSLFYDRPSALSTYQARARRETDFYNLRNDERFARWLNSIRRLKLSVIEARAGYHDIFETASDAYCRPSA